MAVIVKLPSGNWRAQVRRKNSYASNTFRRRAEADAWALEAERTIDEGLDPKAGNANQVQTFADVIAFMSATLRKLERYWDGRNAQSFNH